MTETMLKIGLFIWCTCTCAFGAAAAPAEVFDHGRFGEVSVHRGSMEPRDVVLFLSGEKNWVPQFEAAYERITATPKGSAPEPLGGY